MKILLLVLNAGVIFLMSTASIHAADGTLIGTGTTSVTWENGNWVDNFTDQNPTGVPGATSGTTNQDSVELRGPGTSNSLTVTVDAYRNVKNITLIHGNGTTLTGGTLYLTADGSLTRSATVAGGGGSGGTVGNTINSNIVLLGDYTFQNLTNSRFLRFGLAGSPGISGAAATGSTYTLNLDGSSNLMSNSDAGFANIINSSITDGAAGGQLAVDKNGAGIWVLGGSNSYTGTTTVSEGALYIANRESLYGGNTASWSASNITVQSGAIFGVRVGGSSNITAADIQTLIGLGSATGGFLSGSTFAFDTVLGDFSYNQNITNSNAGANALTLVKRGNNMLTLSGNNSHTGGTILHANGGLLRAASNNALGTGPLTINDPSAGSAVTSGTLQLAGDINLAVSSIIIGPSGQARTATNAPHIENASGDNFYAGNITYQSTSAVISSASGKLTLAGNITTTNTTGAGTAQKLLVLTGAGEGEISGRLMNGPRSVAIHKHGAGTWELSNALNNNSYLGDTQVHAGKLLINTQQAAATGAVTVNAGGTLGGNGLIGGNTTFASGSFLSAGSATNQAGHLSFNKSLDISGLAGDSNQGLIYDLASEETSDSVVLTGSLPANVLSIGSGMLDLNDFLFNLHAQFGAGTYTLFSTNNAILGTLGSSLTGTLGGYDIELAFANNNHDIVLHVVAVPEPAITVLVGIAMGAMMLRRRRHRSV